MVRARSLPSISSYDHAATYQQFFRNTGNSSLIVVCNSGAGEPPSQMSAPLEIDAFVDRQAVEMAAQAIESELRRADAHPVAAAHQSRAARDRTARIDDADEDRGAEIGPVGALVELHQHRQRMARPALLPQLGRDPSGDLESRAVRR